MTLEKKKKKLKELHEMYSKNQEQFPSTIINQILVFQKNQDSIQGAIKYLTDEIKEIEQKEQTKKTEKIKENLAKKQ